jgi:chromosome segregation ATPase
LKKQKEFEMKNNRKPSTTFVLQEINNLFNINGKKHIPDIKEICSKVKINRSTALEHLYKWWDLYQISEQNSEILEFIPDIETPLRSPNALEKVMAGLQCLFKEIEIYSATLNELPNSPSPLGNHLLNSLQEIESEIYVAVSQLEGLQKCKQMLEIELKNLLRENNRLYEEIREMQDIATKKLARLREDLNASRRDAIAANHLVKSLKRKRGKRTATLKSLLYNYVSNSQQPYR